MKTINLKNLSISAIALLVPALPILFISTASDFFKSPIFIFVAIYNSLINPYVLNTAYEVAFCVIVYLGLIVFGPFIGKKSKLILPIFSVVNVLLAGYTILRMGG